MTTPTTIQRQESLARDLLHATRYYLWRPRVLLTLATTAIVAGLALNWNWLVAAGVAPILISILPCLIMCAVGACMMCRSGEKQSAPVGDAADAANRPTMLAMTKTNKTSPAANSSTSTPHSIEAAAPPRSLETNLPAGVAHCCHGAMDESKRKQTINLQPNQQRREPHA